MLHYHSSILLYGESLKKGDVVRQEAYEYEPGRIDLASEATVQWVIEEEASIEYADKLGAFAELELKDGRWLSKASVNGNPWTVIHESAPTFQSQGAAMTDEELRTSVEQMRSGRIIPPSIPKVRKSAVKPSAPTEEDQMSAVLASMSPDQQLELKRKLGLV